jgi:DNA-binding transcriptional ArsR family regulator
MEDERILIDRQTLKAIASDTRMDILKLIYYRKYTLSEISFKLKLSAPTIKEHLVHLINSNLVIREESKNKWKYYTLTDKGKKLVNPKEIKVLISFMVSLFATFGLIGYYVFNFAFQKSMTTGFKESAMAVTYNTSMDKVAVSSSEVLSKGVSNTLTQTSFFNKEIMIVIGIFFLLCLTVFLLVLVIKEKNKNKKNCIKIID